MSVTETKLTSVVALTVAGSDPSGGAGLQADLKTFQQSRVHGMSVVTLLTVQNTRAVEAVHCLPPDFILQQLASVLADIPPTVVKTGALGSAELIACLAPQLPAVPLIVDPVLVSKHGHSLAGSDVAAAYREHLFPRAWLITPNRFELEALTGCQWHSMPSVESALDQLHAEGVPHILIKMGEMDGQATHVLSLRGQRIWLKQPWLSHASNHGAGCVLSAIITAQVGLSLTVCPVEAVDIESIVRRAIAATHRAIAYRNGLGGGISPAETRLI